MATVWTVSAWLTGHWASINCLALLYNAKDTASFYSGHWNTGTNPDLAFTSVGPNSCLPDRRVLEKFPRSQHRPLLITPPRFAMAVPSMPIKRWNFRKAKWSHYIALTNKFAKTLVVRDASNLGNCAGSVADFVAGLWRILCRIWRRILTLALTLAPASSIPRQSDEIALKYNLRRATKLRV